MDNLVLEGVLLFILVLLSAFFSGVETALTSLSKAKLRMLIDRGDKKSKTFALWLNDPGRLLATILFGNNVVNISASVLATIIGISLLGNITVSGNVGLIVTVIMAFIVLVFGELAPKTYARRNAEKIAVRTVGVIRALSILFRPVIRTILYISGKVVKIFSSGDATHSPFVTAEEMKTVISLGEEEGILKEEEREMIDSIFEFGNTKVSEVMVSRMEMTAVEQRTSFREIISLLIKVGHSRIPVYNKTIDNIVGILYAKDVLKINNSATPSKHIPKDLIRQPYFIPETKNVNELLHEFQSRKIHMAIAVDEYGGTSGLITLEDLIEEIVGEIEDEHDIKKGEVEVISDDTVIVGAGMHIDEVNERFGINLPEEEGIETLGGFLTNLIGNVPKAGNVINHKPLTFTIAASSKRRIIKVKIKNNEGSLRDAKDD